MNTPAKRKFLKIGLVLDDGLDSSDGVQQYILAIGEWLRSQGHDVHYLVGETRRTDIQGLHSLSRNVAVRFNGNRMAIPLPTSRRKLRRFLAAERFDILHVQVPYSPFMAQRLILAADKQVAVVGTFHIVPNSGLVMVATRALGVWLRPSLRRFDTMLSVSSAAADFARQTFGVDSVISPNVIDYDRFHNAQPFSRYEDGLPTILFLGRLVPRKGCQLLLEAITLLAERGDAIPRFRVLICGKGPLLTQLQSFVAQKKLGDIVTLVGFVSEADKPRYYASADISVFPSTGGESFGIVLLEAMASGRAAVLAGDNAGYSAVLAPRPALLFNPQDAANLADTLADYLQDVRLRKQAQAWGMNYTKDFDVNIVGGQLLKVYEQALRNRAQT